MPTKKPRYFVYATPEQKDLIESRRARTGMRISEFFIRAALQETGKPLPDKELCDQLLKLSHDLRRVGNLFRMELSNPERFSGSESYRRRLEKDHEDIMAIANRIETAVGGLS